MDEIQKLIERIELFQNSIDKLILEIIESKEDLVISLNVDFQLFEGFNADGQEIIPPYTDSTIEYFHSLKEDFIKPVEIILIKCIF